MVRPEGMAVPRLLAFSHDRRQMVTSRGGRSLDRHAVEGVDPGWEGSWLIGQARIDPARSP